MGKDIDSSQTAFDELKVFTDKYYAGEATKETVFTEAYRQLSGRGVRLRQENGKDPKMTVSVPKVGNVLVIGIRYTKNDGRNTEDHFIFRPNTNIYKCKGKELDKIYSEYTGSHILQI